MNKILYHPTPGTTNFFLMKDVPDQPNEKYYMRHRSPGFNDFIKADSDYHKSLKECKEEAIKNGEIANPEITNCITANYNKSILYWKGKELIDGDLFDLPEGLSVEVKWMALASTGPNSKYVECTEEYAKEHPGFSPKTVIRLVPSNKPVDFPSEMSMMMDSKPETQEELWNEVMDYCEAHYINDIRVLEHFVRKFTITRKK